MLPNVSLWPLVIQHMYRSLTKYIVKDLRSSVIQLAARRKNIIKKNPSIKTKKSSINPSINKKKEENKET